MEEGTHLFCLHPGDRTGAPGAVSGTFQLGSSKVSDRQVLNNEPAALPSPPPPLVVFRQVQVQRLHPGLLDKLLGPGVPTQDFALRFNLVSASVSPLTLCTTLDKSVSFYLKWGSTCLPQGPVRIRKGCVYNAQLTDRSSVRCEPCSQKLP